MATVRVTVTGQQGDVDVTVTEPGTLASDDQAVERLIVAAVTKVRRAYGIGTGDD